MKVLLDECVDRRLASHLGPLNVRTVPQMGWAGVKNGELLNLAEKEFDVFLTVDRNLSFQQPVANRSLAVVVIHAKSNKLSDLAKFAQEIVDKASSFPKGSVTELGV